MDRLAINNLALFVTIVSILFLIPLYPLKFSSFDSFYNLQIVIIGITNILLLWFSNGIIFKSWIRFDTLFLTGFIIVHFQIPFLSYFGIDPENRSFIWENKQVVNYASWLSLACLLAWILGFLVCSRIKIKKNEISTTKRYIVKSHLIEYGLFILFTLFLFKVGKVFLSGGYDVESWGSGATYIYLLLKVFIFLRIIYFYINLQNALVDKYLKEYLYKNLISILLVIVYMLLFLFTGDRGPVLQIVSLNLICYVVYCSNIRPVFIISMFIAGAILFSILGEGRVRDVTKREENIFVEGYQNYTKGNKKTYNIPTQELANSNRILYRAINVVPREHPYLYGLTFFSNIVDLIPLSGSFFNIPLMYSNSALFFTMIQLGKHYTYGEGSEIIADMYINFGPWITLFIFLILGYYISFMQYNLFESKKSHTHIIVYLFLMTVAIYINRSNILNPMKIIVYAIIFDRIFTKKYYIE